MRVLRETWGQKLGLPASRWMLELGAAMMGTETELILKSRRVVPGKLLASGFEFEFPHWRDAARELCEWRRKG
jgi:NAD dependent epimerase/dehydratase family enzyme